jgi:hypothetical protein
MNQRGEGCDYMIGCGSRLDFLVADNLDDAIEEARGMVPSYFDGEETVPEHLFVVSVLHEIAPSSIKLGEDAEEDPERAEYERLKQKFG